jgi:hypothetical protein
MFDSLIIFLKEKLQSFIIIQNLIFFIGHSKFSTVFPHIVSAETILF